MRCIFLFWILLGLLPALTAQEYPVFSMNYVQSKILFHTAKIHIDKAPSTRAIELIYAKQTRGKSYWQQRYGYPEPSLSLLVVDNGNPLIGKTIGIYPSIQFKVLSGKKAFWYWRFGGGIGIVTKHWTRQDTMNNIIGSRINNVSMFQSGIRWTMSSRWSMQSGLVFYHASNASASQPNFGINNYGGFIGLNYHSNGAPKEFLHSPRYEENRTGFGVKGAFALAEDKMPDGPMYSYYNLSMYVLKNYRRKSQILLGGDLTYNSRFYTMFKNTYQFPGKERLRSIRPTIFAGYEFLFGKVGFPLQLGVYASRPLGGPLLYQKLGMNFYLINRNQGWIKQVFLSTQLKTHLAQAELAEIGFGINI